MTKKEIIQIKENIFSPLKIWTNKLQKNVNFLKMDTANLKINADTFINKHQKKRIKEMQKSEN